MEITVNGKSKPLAAGTTVAALLQSLDLQPMRVAVEVNEDLLPRKQFADTVVQDGDTIEIVTFVGGG